MLALALGAAATVGAACGAESSAGDGGGRGGSDGRDGGASDGGGCPAPVAGALGVAEHPEEGILHAVVCSDVCYGTSPPSSGRHYGVPYWAQPRVYEAPVPWGFLVHSLEHGNVVTVYNCPDGCPEEVAAARAWIAGLVDPLGCSPPRAILAPDPTLDVRWAASAWRWTLRAAAFDQAPFQAFFDAHVAATAENFCGGGVDRSATGWCP